MARKKKVDEVPAPVQRFRVVRPAAYVEVDSRSGWGGGVQLYADGRVVVQRDYRPDRVTSPCQPQVTVGDLREALGMLEALSLDES